MTTVFSLYTRLSRDFWRGVIITEAAIEGVQASVDALQLLSDGWCLKIEIVISYSIWKYLITI